MKQPLQTNYVRETKECDPTELLSNNMLFQNAITQAIKRAERYKRINSLLLIQVDQITVNKGKFDNYINDMLIHKIIQRIESHTRTNDAIFCLGDNKFAVVLDEISELFDAGILARRVLHVLSPTYHIDDREIDIVLSIGIACNPYDGNNIIDLFNNVHLALHRAKKTKKRYSYYDLEVDKEVEHRFQIVTDLKQAFEKEQFNLRYQPIYNLTDHTIFGLESLLRWDHPSLDIIGPTEFIPIAEKTQLIVPIGAWILKTACQEFRLWQHMTNNKLSLFVKVSTKQIENNHFIEEICEILDDNFIPHNLLVVEITESIINENPKAVEDFINTLHHNKIRVCLEGFGRGNSSFDYLNKNMIDIIKLDQKLIRNIAKDENDQPLVKALFAMSKQLNIDIIAPGLETKNQLTCVKDSGFNFGQGYILDTPLKPDDVSDKLKQMQGIKRN